MGSGRRPLFVQRADGFEYARQLRLLLRELAGPLVRPQQVSTLHQRQPRAALAVVANLAA